MKKLMLITLAASVSLIGNVAFAADSYVVSHISSIGNVYRAGAEVIVTEPVEGDLNIAGGKVTVGAEISDDLDAAAGELTVSAPVKGDARVAGGKVTVTGEIDGDLAVAGGEVHIGGDESNIGGDVLAVGGKVVLDAPVIGDVQIRGAEVTINSEVLGKVSVMGGKVNIGPRARLSDGFTYSSPEAATIDPSAQITGETKYTPSGSFTAALPSIWKLLLIGLALLVGKILCSFLVALFVAKKLHRYAHAVAHNAYTKTLPMLGWGLVTIFALPILALLSFITVIFIPVGALFLFAFFVVIVFGHFMVPVVLGPWIYSFFTKGEKVDIDAKTVAIGVVVYYIVSLIPVLGWLASFVAFLITVGAMLEVKARVVQEWR